MSASLDDGTYLDGGDGNDIINASGGSGYYSNHVNGGNGDDIMNVHLSSSEASVSVNGGEGADIYNLSNSNNYSASIYVSGFELGIDELTINGDLIDAENFVGGFHVEGIANVFETDTGLSLYTDPDATPFNSDFHDHGLGTKYDLSGITLADLQASFGTEVYSAITDAQQSVALLGTPRNDADGIKEYSGVHLGNGIYLTDSNLKIESTGAGLAHDLTFIHGNGTDNAQDAFIISENTTNRNARDLDGTGSDEIGMINTGVDAGNQIGMVIYADPSEVSGAFTTIGYSRSEHGSTMHEYGITISEDAYQDVTLKNRTDVNDVWVTDGLSSIPTSMLAGMQGSGVFENIDGQDYLAGILVGPYITSTDQAFVVDAVGDNYRTLANQILRVGDADDYATNLLISSSDGGRVRGTGLNEILQGSDSNDVLIGFGGTDRLIDGAGSDRLKGGDGADVFVFIDDGERDVLLDFDVTEDQIDFTDFGVTFDDLAFRDLVNGNVRIDIGDDRFIINNGDNAVDLHTVDLTENMLGLSQITHKLCYRGQYEKEQIK